MISLLVEILTITPPNNNSQVLSSISLKTLEKTPIIK